MPLRPVTLITDAQVLLPDGRLQTATVQLEGGRIEALLPEPPASLLLNHENVEVLPADGALLTLGLIDQQFNGAYGVDLNHASIAQVQNLLGQLPRHGITSILGTLISGPLMDTISAINTLEQVMHLQQTGSGARVLGIHLEGPFLNPECRGAHALPHIRPAALDEMQAMLSPNTRLVTLAPEMDADGAVTRFLTQLGIRVSMGHSMATLDEARAAYQHGARGVTHLFNAMRPFHYRDPGMVGYALTEPDLFVEVIADGVHVHPTALQMVIKAKGPERVILASDANPLAGQAEQTHRSLGSQAIQMADGGRSARTTDGRLAGSVALLDTCVRNLSQWGLTSFAQAVAMASTNPARYLGLAGRTGLVSPGSAADLVLWDPETLTPRYTWVAGHRVYGPNGVSPADAAPGLVPAYTNSV